MSVVFLTEILNYKPEKVSKVSTMDLASVVQSGWSPASCDAKWVEGLSVVHKATLGLFRKING